MTTRNRHEDVVRYAAAVRAAVADLGPAERAQLLDDLEAHLREVAAESDLPLVERLGPPEVYAAELRAAYGAAPPGSAGGSRRPALLPALRAHARAHPWRWRAGAFLLVLVAGWSVWSFGWSQINRPTGESWSQSRLLQEADAGSVRSVDIQGGTAIATGKNGATHAVNVPDTTEELASRLTQDGVSVSYQQSNSSYATFHTGWILLVLLPNVVLLLLVFLTIGVLYRLYRRLGRGGRGVGIM